MKKFLRTHPESVLISLAIVFIAILVCFSLWATGSIYSQVTRALTSPVAEMGSGFNLQNVAALNFRGVTSSTPITAITVIEPTSTISVVTTTSTSTLRSASSSTSSSSVTP